MNLFLLFIIFIIIIIILYLIYKKYLKNCELFSNTENERIKHLFISAQKNNDTFDKFKNKIKNEGIQFGKKNDEIKFQPYYEMYKNYNKNTLEPKNIDLIRNQF